MEDPEPRPSSGLPPIVRRLGWVSFFTDASSDMIYPLLPAFLISLGAGADALGWVEGIAEATAALVKAWAGKLSDRAPAKKPFVVFGYGVATFVRPLLALVSAPWQVVVVRSVDRFGKGVRSAPRDAMVATAVPKERRGHAYGYHRMMDNAGAVLGPSVAFALARLVGMAPRAIFASAMVPGLLALATLVWGVKEKQAKAEARAEARTEAQALAPTVRRYLFVVAVFTLGASADSFLILRMLDLGLPVAYAPLVWLTLNATKALTNVPGGQLSDRIGRRKTLILAWLVYGSAYLLFPLTRSIALSWVLLGGYGVYYGLAEGGEKAIMADVAPEAQRGRAFGWLHAVTGAAVLPANAMFGFLYSVRPEYAFWASAGFAFAGTLLLQLLDGKAQ